MRNIHPLFWSWRDYFLQQCKYFYLLFFKAFIWRCQMELLSLFPSSHGVFPPPPALSKLFIFNVLQLRCNVHSYGSFTLPSFCFFFFHLSCLMFSVLHGSVICHLTMTWGWTLSILLPYSFSGIPLSRCHVFYPSEVLWDFSPMFSFLCLSVLIVTIAVCSGSETSFLSCTRHPDTACLLMCLKSLTLWKFFPSPSPPAHSIWICCFLLFHRSP